MSRLIIGLVGQSGCGKGTVADLLQAEYGAGYFRFSALIGSLLEKLAIEKSRNNFTTLSNTLRTAFGEDVFSYAIEKQALEAPEEIVILDGIRRVEDIVALEPLPLFKLIAIDVDATKRFERMKQRGEKVGEQEMTWEQFIAQDNAATEVTIPFVMKRAWRTIPNNGTREELVDQIHALMSELGYQARQSHLP